MFIDQAIDFRGRFKIVKCRCQSGIVVESGLLLLLVRNNTSFCAFTKRLEDSSSTSAFRSCPCLCHSSTFSYLFLRFPLSGLLETKQPALIPGTPQSSAATASDCEPCSDRTINLSFAAFSLGIVDWFFVGKVTPIVIQETPFSKPSGIPHHVAPFPEYHLSEIGSIHVFDIEGLVKYPSPCLFWTLIIVISRRLFDEK